jgi:hypothetical protein
MDWEKTPRTSALSTQRMIDPAFHDALALLFMSVGFGCFLCSGKMALLDRILKLCKAEGRKVLIFSQSMCCVLMKGDASQATNLTLHVLLGFVAVVRCVQ